MLPSLSDFVTTGGVVAPERFQFFVWTCLGVAAFVFTVLLHDPGSISDLPHVPKEFLYVMGVSSFGYLGGKAVREPGPIIDQIRAIWGSLILEIHGRNLSKDATFEIDGDPVTLDMMAPGPKAPDQGIEEPSVRVIEPDPQGAGRETAKVLELRIVNHKIDWLWKPCQLTIINRDGQRATWPFEHKGRLRLEATPPDDAAKNTKGEAMIRSAVAQQNVIPPSSTQLYYAIIVEYSSKAAIWKLAKDLQQLGFTIKVKAD